MEEYKVISATTLTGVEQQIYQNSYGAIIKTILLYANGSESTKATLSFDGVAFNFDLTGDTKVISTPIFAKVIKASGNGVNIHITGLQL